MIHVPAQPCKESMKISRMLIDRDEPVEANDFQPEVAGLIAGSYLRLTGQPLFPCSAETGRGRILYEAPFVVLAHDISADPVFFYANRKAQKLFEMTWDEMVAMPSRKSAESMMREKRQELLDQVALHGYINDYSGIRVSKSGQRFFIQRATVWNLIDCHGDCHGQAATFSSWRAV